MFAPWYVSALLLPAMSPRKLDIESYIHYNFSMLDV